MPDNKTVSFDASQYQTLIQRAIEIIQDGADSLRECHCCEGDWGDEVDAKQAYDIESAVAGELRAMLAAAPTPAAQSAGQEPVGSVKVIESGPAHEVGEPILTLSTAFEDMLDQNPGKSFDLYAAPVNGGERELANVTAEIAAAQKPLGEEFSRVLSDSLSSLYIDDSAADAQQVGEEIKSALRKAYNLGQIYWQQADSEYVSQQRKSDETHAEFKQLVTDTVAATNANLLEALEEIVKNDPFNQSSAGIIARAAIAKSRGEKE